MFRSVIMRGIAVFVLVFSASAPALADGPFSVYAGPQFISQGTAQGLAGDIQGDVAVGYDFGPKTIVPVRARFDLDDAFGSSNGGRVGVVGIGASARLTTPLYAGLGFSVYNINVRESACATGFAPCGVSASGTGVGTSIFVGSKLFSMPGLGLAIEGSYKKIPTLDGVDPSSFGIGLRASL
jgi:hypothetical protein